MKTKLSFFGAVFISMIASLTTNAQVGYSSASLSMNRSNGVSAPDQVIVEEYINYHKHNIPLPKAGEEIALDLRWGTNFMDQGERSAVLQVGIASATISDYSQMPPINVCIVIDKSGSMSSDNKMEKVKYALTRFMEGLRPDDIISIVAFDDDASLLLAPERAGNMRVIKDAILKLGPGGSTNLNAGMILGYKTAQKNFNVKGTNRVILLTDGIANVGETSPDGIASNSEGFNQEGIDISTIGVGTDINYSLMQRISKTGRGLNHFVGESEEDIYKVFDAELESLLYPIAGEVSLELVYNDNVELEGVIGYDPVFEKNKVRFELDNINSGLTQVVLMKLKLKDQADQLPVKAYLKFNSRKKGKDVVLAGEETIGLAMKQDEVVKDADVKKNYFIAYMAESMKNISELNKQGHRQEAYEKATEVFEELDNEYPQLKDTDIMRVRDILENNFSLWLNWTRPVNYHTPGMATSFRWK